MKPFRTIALGLMLSCFAPVAGKAQNVFYTWNYFDLGENAMSDALIRETRKGDEVLKAEIDFCFQREFQGKWDRVILPLKFEGGKYSGAGTSLVAKIPVTIDLAKKPAKDAFALTGAIKMADATAKVEQENVLYQKIEELPDTQESITLVENPADFTVVQPNVVAIRFRLGELRKVLAALRGEPLVLDTNYGLIEDCTALRTGRQTIQVTTPPENAAALVAKLRKLNGVLTVGWAGYGALDQATRAYSLEWMKDGKLDRDKLAQQLIKSVSNATNAKFLSSRWEGNTGQLILELERPSTRFQDAAFSESMTVRLLVSPERLGSPEYLVVSVVSATANLLDAVSGPRLDIPPFHEVGGEGYVAPDQITATIAKDLNGAIWDSGTEKWVLVQ